MSTISPITRSRIKAYLGTAVVTTVEQVRLGERLETNTHKRRNPISIAIHHQTILQIAYFKRQTDKILCPTFAECARLIALDHHADAQVNYQILGQASGRAVREIDEFEMAYDWSQPDDE